MPATVADFVQAAEETGILTADVLAEYAQGDAPDADAAALVNRLVKAGRLTAFQARHISGGRARSLVLGPYVVLDLLGKGGMGSVYKAEHRRMRRVVALKVIARTALKSPAAVQRFEREVQAAARLEHPNIVTAFDAGEAGGTHYLVMQFVDGRTLSEVVRETGRQPVGRAVDWVLQAAQGLAFAHEQGVIHRDIKPANLLVDARGTLKILDMGLARLETLDADQDQLTGTGQIMGTVDYMAPEQAMDTRQADARSDIYSLGVTLWYLLAGRPLFEAESVVKKIMAHQQTPPPPLTSVRGDIPPEVEAAFQRMVAKQPADRFQSMAEVIAALRSTPENAAAALPPGMAFRVSAAPAGSLGTDVTQTLQLPQAVAVAAEEETARLSAVNVDTDLGLERAAPGPPRSRGRLQPLHLAIGGGVAGVVLLVGLMLVAAGGRRGDQPAGQRGEAADGPAPRPASRLDAAASGAGAPPTAAARAEPRAIAPSPAPGSSTPPPPAVAPFDTVQARAHQEAWARHLGIGVETTGSIGQTLVVIPPGRFTMGEGDTIVDVTLTRPFLLGRTEVTQGQWQEVMGTEPWLGREYTIAGGDVAVTWISRNDAAAFCAALTERERRLGTIGAEQVYRLPTEAEWEFACRAGTTTMFAFGDDDSRLGDHGWFGGGWASDGPRPEGNTAREQYVHPVGLKRPNPFGLFDMHGNAWEWVADWQGDYPRTAVTDPQGPSGPSTGVNRGGCWNAAPFGCRSGCRIGRSVGDRFNDLGFRVALTAPRAPPPEAPATP